MLGYIRLEILRLLRNGSYLMMSLVMPVGMYVSFAGGGPGQASLARSMVGAAAFGTLGVVITSGTGIAEDRALGWLRQLRLTPLSPLQVVVARGAVATCLAILPVTAISLIGAFYHGVELGAGQWIGIFVLLWIGVAPLAMLGIGIGYLLPAQLAQVVSMVCYISLTLLGGLLLPISNFPAWAQTASRATPVFRYAQLSWNVAANINPSVAGIGVIVVWTALLAGFASFAYRRGGRVA